MGSSEIGENLELICWILASLYAKTDEPALARPVSWDNMGYLLSVRSKQPVRKSSKVPLLSLEKLV